MRMRSKGTGAVVSQNNVTIVGNATREPELRFTASGSATASFGVAVNRKWQNRQTNEWEEQVSFFNVVTWRQLAENVAESISKGTRVIVTGRIEQRSWETPDGQKRSVTDVVADSVGPDLSYATCQIQANERQARTGNKPADNQPPQSNQNLPYDYDEEPF
jgi:single-strand DNA-binding protein